MKLCDKEPTILECDNHLLVLNKPAGMLTQPAENVEESLELFGKNWLKKKFQKPGRVFLEPIHRLDKSVSGIVLFARTSKALSRLQEAMRSNLIEKKYLAFVEGDLHGEGRAEHYLVHGDRISHVVPSHTKEAKWSALTYQVLKNTSKGTLLQITLETGRYHQIRAQFAAMGHPILGDRKYGAQDHFSQIALHHYQLQAPHPISGELISWEAPHPEIFNLLN